MMTSLIASAPRARASTTGVAASVLIHSALILGSVLATSRVVSAAKSPPEQHTLLYVAPPAPSAPIVSPPRATRPKPPAPTAPPPVAPVVVVPMPPAVVLPVIDRIAPLARETAMPVTTLPTGAPAVPTLTSGSVSAGRGPALGDGAPYTDGQVDRAVTLLRSSPPRYPDQLRRLGATGAVLVRFVVGADGQVEPESIAIVDATQDAFGVAVRAALLLSRFRPAEVGGRPVRQLVEQRFTFALDR
jgi:protein TonB